MPKYVDVTHGARKVQIQVNPGGNLQTAVELHGEDEVFALYEAAYIRGAASAARRALATPDIPDGVAAWAGEAWRPRRYTPRIDKIIARINRMAEKAGLTVAISPKEPTA